MKTSLLKKQLKWWN